MCICIFDICTITFTQLNYRYNLANFPSSMYYKNDVPFPFGRRKCLWKGIYVIWRKELASLKRQNKTNEKWNVNKEKMRRERRKDQVFYALKRNMHAKAISRPMKPNNKYSTKQRKELTARLALYIYGYTLYICPNTTFYSPPPHLISFSPPCLSLSNHGNLL